ncbi:hypothetical protein Lal_00018381 [Lupinus albus]|nr:hypothetical protein Lal_00018381 [Lupinus albus]
MRKFVHVLKTVVHVVSEQAEKDERDKQAIDNFIMDGFLMISRITIAHTSQPNEFGMHLRRNDTEEAKTKKYAVNRYLKY